MSIFVTSDQHFFHTNIIRYCNRPFVNAIEMNAALIQNWNSVVTPEDIVIHVGDFGFGSTDQLKSVFSQLNGIKNTIIRGNHDGKISKLANIGFMTCVREARLEHSGYRLLFKHQPDEDDVDIRSDVDVVIHGHTHSYEKFSLQPKHFNVCVEAHEFKPVRLDDIMAMWKIRQEELNTLHADHTTKC